MFTVTVFAIVMALISCSSAAESSNKSLPSVSQTGSAVRTLEKTEVTLKQAINIVEKRRLTECVARTICELSCNPEAYGTKGKALYETLKPFESDTLPKLAYYKSARDKGVALAADHKCADCFKLYAQCKASTQSILNLASSISIKQ